MSTLHHNEPVDPTSQEREVDTSTRHIFSDPVTYLAAHGIEAFLVVDTSLPVAA